jgi:hypothetical protein
MSYELHGDTGTRLHSIWKAMKCRCNNSNHPSYKWYGARGISVAEEWQDSYICFKEWAMSHGYSDNLELERIDVNEGYSPKNCKWISHHEQTLNRRDTLYATLDGRTMKLRELCAEYKISIHTANHWRHQNILEDKLTQHIGKKVQVSGGKKVVTS